MTDREIYERLREPLMRFASSLVGWQNAACAQWLTFDSATREWNEVHVPGWEALLAPDGSAIYALTPTGESSVLHRYDLGRRPKGCSWSGSAATVQNTCSCSGSTLVCR